MRKFLKFYFKQFWLYLLIWTIIEIALIRNISDLLLYNSLGVVIAIVASVSSLPFVIGIVFYNNDQYREELKNDK